MAWFRRKQREEDLDAELRAYAEMLAEEERESGRNEAEVFRRVRWAMGSIEGVKDAVRDARRFAWLDEARQDLAYAARALGRSPAFTLAAILSIGLGVGANTGVFTLVNAILLRPLPVAEPNSLVAIYQTEKLNGGENAVSWTRMQEWRNRASAFQDIAGTAGPLPVPVDWENASAGLFVEFASAAYFPLLGLRPAAGRFYAERDDTRGSDALIVLSYSTWRRRFAGSTDILNRKVRVNGRAAIVIGVAPEGFRGLSNFFGPEAWLNAGSADLVLGQQGKAWLTERETSGFQAVARLRAGMRREQAQDELRRIFDEWVREYPSSDQGLSVIVRPIEEASLFPGLRQSAVGGSALLLGIVAMVLMIACANVANLLYARGQARRSEIATRVALGAGPLRIVRQLLTESLLLAVGGAVAGLLMALAAKEALWVGRPAIVAESLIEPQVDANVFLFTLAISIAAGVLFGLAPAVHAARDGAAAAMQQGGRSTPGPEAIRVTRYLVPGQVALAGVCLVAGGIFYRTVAALYESDPGFRADGLAMVSASPIESGLSSAQASLYYADARRRVESLPQVERAAWATNPLLFGGPARAVVPQDGGAGRGSTRRETSIVNVVEPGYFATVGLSLAAGRDFDDRDLAKNKPVAIVNQAFEKQYWPGQSALGKRFRFVGEEIEREIVGVARTATLIFLGEAPQPCAYLPREQAPPMGMVLYVRSKRTAGSVLPEVSRILLQVDAQVAPANAMTARELLDNNLWIARSIVGLFGAFGLLALALACVGLYGVMAYSVGLRQRELGVRIALGASPSDIVGMVLGQGLRVAGTGAATGLALGLLMGKAIERVLPSAGGAEFWSAAAAAALILATAGAASGIPAWRASRTSAACALREG
jgi:predicted permease